MQFREDFETGTTTMYATQSNGEVAISSEKPISGGYSAQLRALFSPSVFTYARLNHDISPAIPEVEYEALVRIDTYEPRGMRLLYIQGELGSLCYFGVSYAGRQVFIWMPIIGSVGLGRYVNIGEPFHVKIRLKCASAEGVADGAITVWLNGEMVYANSALDNWAYGLVSRAMAGCEVNWAATSDVAYAEVSVDDLAVDDLTLPPTYYQLSIDVTPIAGVRFGLNGIEKTTPYSEQLEEGSYTIVMPSEVTANGDIDRFARWTDGDTNSTRTISLNADVPLVAEYELYTPPPPPPPTTHQLTIDSTPIQGIPFTIEKVTL